MYGGLFGDLPPTKEQQQQGIAGTVNETQINASSTLGGNSTNAVKDDPFSKQKKAPSSVVRQLGTSGTAVAFVPAAARRKNVKRPSTNSSSSSIKESHKHSNTATTSQELVSTTTLKVSAWVARPPETKQHQQDEDDALKTDHNITPEHPAAVPMEATQASKSGDDDGVDPFTTGTSAYITKHTHQSDRYDPFLPNDLLEYWERKAAEETWRVQEAEQARRHQEQMEQMHRNQEQTRQLSTAEPPRGRGRGLSNLPAWMVEQQRRQEALGSAST